AIEKGPFPAWDSGAYSDSLFIQELPEEIQEHIVKTGTRNSHLISIAPTGTISLTANNVSSGIEPVFAYFTDRVIRDFDSSRIIKLEDYGHATWGTKGRTSTELKVEDHLAVVRACVPYVDSAISKTCIVPSTMKWEDFKNVYRMAWTLGAKGITTYTDGGKREGILSASEPDEKPAGPACSWDPATGERSCE
ncbi:MAG: ribonucleoside-diphosphate reductase, adenosylcobalamin-dependent, partial [Anaerolineae bacterium]|nr:ribonucleoside-diphosphate reductase, adenosylcobalamin-dependent [Anaerolineae bacterium]